MKVEGGQQSQTTEEEIAEQLLEYNPRNYGGMSSSLDNSPTTRKTVGFHFPDDLKSNDGVPAIGAVPEQIQHQLTQDDYAVKRNKSLTSYSSSNLRYRGAGSNRPMSLNSTNNFEYLTVTAKKRKASPPSS